MKIVLIQGEYLACYVGRKQLGVIQVHDWSDTDVKAFIEDFRVRGLKAVEE